MQRQSVPQFRHSHHKCLPTTRNIWSADFKDLAGVYQVSRSELHFNKCNPTFTFYRDSLPSYSAY